MGDTPYIWWRGKRMTAELQDAIRAAQQRAGFPFVITQGGFNGGAVAASAGTHDGDAVDFRTKDLSEKQVAAMVEALRWAGIAAWLRTEDKPLYGVRAQGFSVQHVHGVPNGWGLPSAGAKRQAAAYRAGRDGLARNLADIGPGHTKAWYGRTSPRKPVPVDTRTELERYLDAMDDKKFKELVAEAVGGTFWDPPIKERKNTGDHWGNSLRHSAAAAAHDSALTLGIVRELARRQNIDVDEAAIVQGLVDSLGPALTEAVERAVAAGGSPQVIAEAVRVELGAALVARD